MYAAAAEGDGDLHDGRGDAYCGMLNCSYNLGLRGKTAYIPEYPVGTAPELAEKVAEFVPIARAILGLRGLKLITFGPRPDDFLACNGPIKALYDLGVAVEENSELDLLVAYNKHADDPRIPAKMAEMQAELGGNNKYAGVLPRLAQYELTRWTGPRPIQRRAAVCGVCQQVLARVPDGVQICALLCKQPPCGHGNSRFLRGGYLRRAVRVHRRVRFRRAHHAAGHQQHRARIHLR